MNRSGKAIIKYVRDQADIIGVKEIEIYSNARIKSVTIAAWDAGKTNPQRYSIYRLEQALQKRAVALGINREVNSKIFDY